MVEKIVRSIRLSDENHKELLKIVGVMQAKSGETTTMDDVVEELIKTYRRRK